MAIQGLCFALCFFAFQLTEFTVNDRAEVLLGAEWVNAVYSAGIACTALGFLSFSVLRRIFAGERKRKAVMCTVGLISMLTSFALLTTSSKELFLVSSFFCTAYLWTYRQQYLLQLFNDVFRECIYRPCHRNKHGLRGIAAVCGSEPSNDRRCIYCKHNNQRCRNGIFCSKAS